MLYYITYSKEEMHKSTLTKHHYNGCTAQSNVMIRRLLWLIIVAYTKHYLGKMVQYSKHSEYRWQVTHRPCNFENLEHWAKKTEASRVCLWVMRRFATNYAVRTRTFIKQDSISMLCERYCERYCVRCSFCFILSE